MNLWWPRKITGTCYIQVMRRAGICEPKSHAHKNVSWSSCWARSKDSGLCL